MSRTASKTAAPKTDRAKTLKKSASRAAELLNLPAAADDREQYLAAARERARIYHLREQAIKEGRPVPPEAMPKSARGKARLEARVAAAKGAKPATRSPSRAGAGARLAAADKPTLTREPAAPLPAHTEAYLAAQAEARARKAAERAAAQPAPVAPVAVSPRSAATISRAQLVATLEVLIASETSQMPTDPSNTNRAHVLGIVDGLQMALRLVRLMGE